MTNMCHVMADILKPLVLKILSLPLTFFSKRISNSIICIFLETFPILSNHLPTTKIFKGTPFYIFKKWTRLQSQLYHRPRAASASSRQSSLESISRISAPTAASLARSHVNNLDSTRAKSQVIGLRCQRYKHPLHKLPSLNDGWSESTIYGLCRCYLQLRVCAHAFCGF